MKGKGKGDRGGDVKGKNNFTDFAHLDISKKCPIFSSVVNDNEADAGLSLDVIQTELETLLSSVGLRMCQLTKELDALAGDARSPAPKQESRGKELRSKPANGSGSGAKRSAGKAQEEKPCKKQKLEKPDDSSTDSDVGGGGTSKKADVSASSPVAAAKRSSSVTPTPGSSKRAGGSGKAAGSKDGSKARATPGRPPKAKIAAAEVTDPLTPLPPTTEPAPTPPPRIVKNDAPNRFWALVDPYCCDITSDDLKVLDDIMRAQEDNQEYYRVPPRGKHYVEKWAHDDMLEEQRQGKKLADSRRASSSAGSDASSDVTSKKSHDSASSSAAVTTNGDSPYGSLTQRLMSSLIEENVSSPLDDCVIESEPTDEAAAISPGSLRKQLNIGNTVGLERSVKRELQQEGLLDGPSDVSDDDDDNDEVLAELHRKQKELRALSAANLATTRQLYKLAQEEMARQETRRKLVAADAEVTEAYKRLTQNRTKKKTATKKDIDAVKRALRERQAIVKLLDSDT